MVFLCSTCACVGSRQVLPLPPTVQKLMHGIRLNGDYKLAIDLNMRVNNEGLLYDQSFYVSPGID